MKISKLKVRIKSNTKFIFNLFYLVQPKDIETWLALNYSFLNFKKFNI
jgi:hypothetical protein